MSDDILTSVFNLTGMTSKSSRKGFLPSTSNLRFLENRRETVCVSVAVSVWRSDERLEVLERISVHGIALKAPQKNLLYSLKIHTTQPLRGMFSKILQKYCILSSNGSARLNSEKSLNSRGQALFVIRTSDELHTTLDPWSPMVETVQSSRLDRRGHIKVESLSIVLFAMFRSTVRHKHLRSIVNGNVEPVLNQSFLIKPLYCEILQCKD